MRLEKVTLNSPHGLAKLLADLGNGENGFGGTAVPRGKLSLDEYLHHCVEINNGACLQSWHIPQTFFWFLDDSGEAIGIVRMWHYLNESLKERTGHISYYIRRDKRSKGYGREALRQALLTIRDIGEARALIITDLDNIASIRIIQENGGILESVGRSGEGKDFGRYWIDLET